jgi:pyridoxal phosphate enzyme (YggS family)
MAVTKTHGREVVREAREAGIRVFGENRVREAQEKFEAGDSECELHLIGRLQSNKTRSAAGLFSWVDSLDSFRTAAALDARLAEAGRQANVLLEVNTSGEESKSGYGSFDELLRELDAILALPRLSLRGLMTVGPLTGAEERVREAFRSLAASFESLKKRVPDTARIDTLSMGMSGDFEIAVEEGSSLIRLGTVLFGRRT